MGAAKRLKNHAGVRGTLTSDQGGNGPTTNKRGLKGDMGAGARWTGGSKLNPHDTRDAYAEATGVTAVATGDAGLGGGANTVVGRGSSEATQGGDNRSVLDSDGVPLGQDGENAALATFTVATGTGGAGTFDVTGANTGNIMRVSVFEQGSDTDEDGDLILVDYVAADGSAKSISLGTEYAGDTVVVYGEEMDATTEAAALSAGIRFRTRRTVTTDDA